MNKGARIPKLPADPRARPLSQRQLDVWALIARGLCQKEIADELGLSPGTVKVHTQFLFERLGVRNRTEAALKWQRAA